MSHIPYQEYEVEDFIKAVVEENVAYMVPKKDVVNKPDHYNTGGIECIDYLKDNMPHEAFVGYLEGNFKKYVHRYRYKGKPVEDLKKASWYLNRLIQEVESK
jgi:hypothetical protein